MKKNIALIIGFSLFVFGLTSQSQDAGTNSAPVITSQTETIKASITLPVGVGAAIASQATISQGSVQSVGTNIVISGMAVIIMPASQFGQYVTGLPSDYDVTNLARSSFQTTTNGVVVNAVLTKLIQ